MRAMVITGLPAPSATASEGPMTRRKSLEKQQGPSAGESEAERSQPAAGTSRAAAANGELVVYGAPERFVNCRVNARLHRRALGACRRALFVSHSLTLGSGMSAQHCQISVQGPQACRCSALQAPVRIPMQPWRPGTTTTAATRRSRAAERTRREPGRRSEIVAQSAAAAPRASRARR